MRYHDLVDGRWLVTGLEDDRNPHEFSEGSDPREFGPKGWNQSASDRGFSPIGAVS